jgi:GTP cyclohydrolase II
MSAARASHSVARAVARTVDELRRGQAVQVLDGDVALVVLALEQASDATLADLERVCGGVAQLLISGARAATLKLTSHIAAAGEAAVMVTRTDWLDLPAMMAAADPVDDLSSPLKGPFQVAALGSAARAALAALRLLKQARLLPAGLVVLAAAPPGWEGLTVLATDVLDGPARAAASLKIAASAKVPLQVAEQTRVLAFRSDDGSMEHLALLVGDPLRDRPVLTRLHSECFTGDLLGSLKCDCGPQLQGALARLAAEKDGGVLVYLAQEGRGIGLINKLRAYNLQDQGFDTVDANIRLGFEIDERQFAPAAKILSLLGFSSVRLLTNNPDKVAGLHAAGITVAERVAHQFSSNRHNEAYLRTKQQRTGHLLTQE